MTMMELRVHEGADDDDDDDDDDDWVLCCCIVALHIFKEWHRLQNCSNGVLQHHYFSLVVRWGAKQHFTIVGQIPFACFTP